MSLLPFSSDPDSCPVCGVSHDRIEDELWSCPVHRHQLQFADVTGAGMNRYTCPAHRCQYERCAPRTNRENPMTEIEVRADPTPIDLMWKREKQFAAVLPEHIDARAFIGTALAALHKNPDLMKAAQDNPGSFIAALMECASLGHRPGTEEYYLTPRKNNTEVVGIEGYKGIIERFYRSGQVRNIVVREVCENDRFAFIEGEDEKPIHRFGSQNSQNGAQFFGPDGMAGRGAMVGVYAYAVMKDGGVSRVTLLTRDDVMAAKAAGGAGDSKYSPWNREDGGPSHPEFKGRSMWWKTAAKRLEPWVPKSADYRLEQLRAEAQAAPAWLPDPAEVDGITAEAATDG